MCVEKAEKTEIVVAWVWSVYPGLMCVNIGPQTEPSLEKIMKPSGSGASQERERF